MDIDIEWPIQAIHCAELTALTLKIATHLHLHASPGIHHALHLAVTARLQSCSQAETYVLHHLKPAPPPVNRCLSLHVSECLEPQCAYVDGGGAPVAAAFKPPQCRQCPVQILHLGPPTQPYTGT